MIISRRRNYVFVHVPKTGGTSLSLALEDRAAPDDILIGDTPKARRRKGRLAALSPSGRLWKHSTLADIDGIVTPGDLAQMHVVTLIRNPWDRMVSYYHWARAQTFDHPAVTLARRLDFTAFVNAPEIIASFRAHPVTRYLTDAEGRCHDDGIIRLEHFATDSAAFAAHLGFPLDLPWANTSERRRDWRPYYTAESVDAVAKACAADIALGGYAFDPSD